MKFTERKHETIFKDIEVNDFYKSNRIPVVEQQPTADQQELLVEPTSYRYTDKSRGVHELIDNFKTYNTT